MSREEVLSIMALLNALYSRSPHPEKSRERVKAWTMALAQFDYGEVKKAALKRVTESRFYPDVADIIALIPEREKVKPPPRELLRWLEEERKKCGNLGVPTAADAKKQGLSFNEYCRLAENAGI